MAKTKISEYDATAANNTDIDSINIAEGMAPSNVNNAIREMMAHLKDMDAGTQALTSPQLTSVDINGGTADNLVIGGTTAAAGSFTTIDVSGTGLVTGVLTTTAQVVQNGGFDSNDASTIVAQDGAADNQFALQIQNLESTNDRSYGLYIQAGTTVTDSPLHIYERTGSTQLFRVTGTGQTLFTDGSGSLPSITNIGDTNTGIFFPAADTIAFSEGGSEAMRIDSNGDVQIGTDTSSGAKLTLFGSDAATTFQSSTTGTGASNGFTTGNNGAVNTFLWNYEDGFMQFATNNTERMRLDENGNVGIGTDSPLRSLHISGTGDTGLMLQTTAATDDSEIWEIQVAEDASSLANLVFRTRANNGTGGSEAMRINRSGNVGIGATDPKRHLHINGGNESTKIQITNTTTGSSSDGDGFQIGIAANGTANLEQREDADMVFSTDNTERLRILNTGSVLQLGGTSSSGFVDFNGTSLQLTTQRNPETGTFSNAGRVHAFMDLSDGNGTASNAHIRFGIGSSNGSVGSEAVRIDSNGDLLVGGTSSNPTGTNVAGAAIDASGEGNFSVDGAEALRLNRKSSDGEILSLRKDAAPVGSISVGGSSDQPVIGSANATAGGTAAGLRFDRANNSIQPWNVINNVLSDDTIDLGFSSMRFDDIFATNGTIQTSDQNEKQDIAALTATEMKVGKRISALFKTFKFKSSVTDKGDAARTHTGIIAQDVQAAFSAEGLDASKYALWCSNTWTNDDGSEQTRLGIRYPELLSFLASYNEQRFTDIEARITALEGA